MISEFIKNCTPADLKTICKVITNKKIEQYLYKINIWNVRQVCQAYAKMQGYMYENRKDKVIYSFIASEIKKPVAKIMCRNTHLPITDGNALLKILDKLFESGFADNPILFFKLDLSANFKFKY